MILVGVWSSVAAADLEQRERAGLAGGPLRLGRGDLHRLVLRLDYPQLIADQHGEQDGWHQHDQGQPGRPGEDLAVTAVPQLPGRDRQHDGGAGGQRGEQDLGVAPDEHRVGEQRPDVVQLRLAVHHLVADRVLHPGVGGQDERRRQHAADADGPDGGQVHPFGELVPAEQPQPQERGLQEERAEPFHRQRGAEHVADQPGVGAPVHPELELLHQPGDHADRDVDDEQRAEEPGQPQVVILPGPVPGGLQQRGQERQPDRHRNEKEMVNRRERELNPRQIGVHRVASPGQPGTRPVPMIRSPARPCLIPAGWSWPPI